MDALENSLISKMSQMTTDDRENLILKFTDIIAPRAIPHELAAFYLDLANWNLSTAISVFYDQNGDLVHMEEAFRQSCLSSTVKECTNKEAISGTFTYRPNTTFFIGWRVVNDGRFRWPDGTRLAFVDGDPIDYEVWKDTVLDPDASENIEIRITCPFEMGDFKARFQFVTPQNIFFGESIWVILRVRPLTEAEAAMEVFAQPMDPFPRQLMPYQFEGPSAPEPSPVPDPPQGSNDEPMME
ncbi:hypothetical protein L5515_016584 [Caenorhabditis briggsae]|uniref:Nbr1 FW domain-containing protein n=2 Tax=Caenorhabditis briggsae TaxID=6238 RepID=A0AAE9FDZ0_CAEBR|nr:hypothetical protein L5515_016584 [Caenorhabditis briggsae]